MSIKKVTITIERLSKEDASANINSQNMGNIDLMLAATALVNKISEDSGYSPVGLAECIVEYFKEEGEGHGREQSGHAE